MEAEKGKQGEAGPLRGEKMKEVEFPGDMSSHKEAVIRTMAGYDMMGSPDEAYYARQYMNWILPELEARFPGRGPLVLDLGCGQGRFSLPLARWNLGRGGEVIGVDLAGPALEKARERASGLPNLSLHEADLLEFLEGQQDDSFDAILLIEVTFFLPKWKEALGKMARVLKPGGVCFVAFRSQYYNLLQNVWSWRWEGARMALEKREGYLWGEPVWYTWQTPDEIKEFYQELGLRPVNFLGIGVCSGLEEDPHGTIIRPSQLSVQEQDLLMEIECRAAEAYAACGRYILAIAEKPQSP